MGADIGYRGHDVRRVRDREDYGSNPSPATTVVFKIGLSETTRTRRYHNLHGTQGHWFES
jgi:hypothetical protein